MSTNAFPHSGFVLYINTAAITIMSSRTNHFPMYPSACFITGQYSRLSGGGKALSVASIENGDALAS